MTQTDTIMHQFYLLNDTQIMTQNDTMTHQFYSLIAVFSFIKS